jgi:perosamine synthetase
MEDVARRHHLVLIEDAAEAMGASIGDKKAGSFGDAAILSFCQNKVITTGEGGAIATDSREIYEKLKLIRSHGRQETADYFSSTEYMDYVSLGYNFRMSNITAALGLAQLKKLPKLVEMRRNNARLFDNRLSSIKGVAVPSPPEGFFHVYQLYTIRVPAGRRDGLIQHLADGGIMSKVYFAPVHDTSFYKNRLKYDCHLPMTEAIARQVLTLPMYPSLSEEEIDDVTRRVSDYFSRAP